MITDQEAEFYLAFIIDNEGITKNPLQVKELLFH